MLQTRHDTSQSSTLKAKQCITTLRKTTDVCITSSMPPESSPEQLSELGEFDRGRRSSIRISLDAPGTPPLIRLSHRPDVLWAAWCTPCACCSPCHPYKGQPGPHRDAARRLSSSDGKIPKRRSGSPRKQSQGPTLPPLVKPHNPSHGSEQIYRLQYPEGQDCLDHWRRRRAREGYGFGMGQERVSLRSSFVHANLTCRSPPIFYPELPSLLQT